MNGPKLGPVENASGKSARGKCQWNCPWCPWKSREYDSKMVVDACGARGSARGDTWNCLWKCPWKMAGPVENGGAR